MEKNVVFDLSEPIEVAIPGKGEIESYYSIELFPPAFICFAEATKIQQAITRTLQAMAKKENLSEEQLKEAQEKISEKTEDDAIDSTAVKVALLGSHENLSEIIKNFITICTYVGRFDEKVRVKDSHLKKMSYDDIINMTCFYIANFLMPSFS